MSPVLMPSMTHAQTAGWLALLDLHDRIPAGWTLVGGQMVQIDKSLEEAAWVNGATRAQGIWRILLPLVTPSVQGAYFLLFMAFFREISSAILISLGLFSAAAYVFSVPFIEEKAYEIERDASRTILDNVFELVSRI